MDIGVGGGIGSFNSIKSGKRIFLKSHLHLVPRLRISVAPMSVCLHGMVLRKAREKLLTLSKFTFVISVVIFTSIVRDLTFCSTEGAFRMEV
jgi:hypothetical protein